jgi:hypothetical protein
MLNINGVNCHETGCPDEWQDYFVECKWCGGGFKPKEKGDTFCCDDCSLQYYS